MQSSTDALSRDVPKSFTLQSDQPPRLHVAIIMDGNGRWASRRGLSRSEGHRAGIAAVRGIVECAPALGIGCLTLYAFSSDNWKRPAPEVETIFWLLRVYLRREAARLRRQGARLDVIGRRDRLPERLVREITRAEHLTASGEELRLRVAVDYSSRDSIARAATASDSQVTPTPLAQEAMRQRLASALSAPSGDVDLLIRTGGEKRLSDFLLWESAYAELFFCDVMWPDFDAAALENALQEFRSRHRRFGGLPGKADLVPSRIAGGSR